MQTLKGTSLKRLIRQATAVFALFVAYAASAAETQQAFANGQTLTGDLVLRAAEVGDSATFRADGSFLMPAVDVARGEWPIGFFLGNNGTPVIGLHATTDAAKQGAAFAAQDAVERAENGDVGLGRAALGDDAERVRAAGQLETAFVLGDEALLPGEIGARLVGQTNEGLFTCDDFHCFYLS